MCKQMCFVGLAIMLVGCLWQAVYAYSVPDVTNPFAFLTLVMGLVVFLGGVVSFVDGPKPK